MKKLLVLLMVLGLVGSANAGLSLSLSSSTINVGETVTATVSSDNANFWTGDFILSEDLVNWPASTVAGYVQPVAWSFFKTAGAGSAGDLGSATVYPGFANVYTLNAAGSTVLPEAGTQFSIQIVGNAAGTISLGLQNDTTFEDMASPITLTVLVPEPMTMALLGLGGLFLRRRK